MSNGKLKKNDIKYVIKDVNFTNDYYFRYVEE